MSVASRSQRVKETPMLYTGKMVRAILARRKRQTRRMISRLKGFRRIRQFGPSTTPGYDWCFRCHRGLWHEMRTDQVFDRCPYGGIGDRIWVRETFRRTIDDKSFCVVQYQADETIRFQLNEFGGEGDPIATKPHKDPLQRAGMDGPPWKPSIHMPRYASRILLQITSVGIQQVQSITEEDALAEGCFYAHGLCVGEDRDLRVGRCWPHARQWYKSLWKELHGEESWGANPWVWVIGFEILSTSGGDVV